MRTIRVQANENFVPRYQTTYLLPKFYYRAKPKPSLESLEPMQDFLVIGGWAERPLSHSFVRDPSIFANIRVATCGQAVNILFGLRDVSLP